MTARDPIAERIEADIRAESRGRDAADIFIRPRIAAGLRREAILGNRPNRPIIAPEGAGIAPDSEGEASDGLDWFHAAQGDYQAVCANQTGRIIADEAFEEARRRQDEKNAQSIALADALDSTGRFPFPFNHGEKWANRCTVIDLFSGAIIPLPPLRRVVFMPSFAAMLRSKLLRDAEHFLQCYAAGECRMFTMTRGERVVFESPDQFRDEVMQFTRKISRLNTLEPFRRWHCARKDRRRLGRRGWRQVVQIELRGVEFGEPQFEGGKLTLHVHAHLIVRELVPLTGKQRANFRRRLWRRWGKVWDDAGAIQNPREFVKYPVKPADLDKIMKDGGPGLLADFYQAVKGLHLFQPMGELRTVRRTRRENARRITAFSRPDGRTLEETGDWNAAKRPISKPKRHRAELKRATEDLAARLATPEFLRKIGGGSCGELGVSRGAIPEPETNARRFDPETGDSGNNRPETPHENAPGPRIANRIVSRLAPAPYGGPILTPAVVVWGFDGNREAVLRQPLAAAIIARHRAAYDDAVSARALIRACAPACAPAPRAAGEGSQRSNNCPRAPRPPDPWRTSDLLAWAET